LKYLQEFWEKQVLRRVLKNEDTEERTYFALTIATGICSALAAIFLHYATLHLTKYFGTDDTFTWKAFIYGAFAVFISGFLTTRLFPNSAGSGMPGVRLSLAVFHGKISFKDTMAKMLVTIFSLSSGISLGREGPTVTIASGIGSAFGNLFHLSKKKVKALVAIGAAGGISAVFQTPITAVIFTLEEVVGDLNAKILGSIIIASVVASITSQMLTGNSSFFTELHYSLHSPVELIFYLLIGLVAAIVGPLWAKLVLWLREKRSSVFKGHTLSVIMLTFLVMVAISFIRPEVLSSGHETIEEALLSLILDWRLLLSLFALKFFASALCYSSGISGGLYMPVLLMGATLGSLVGSVCQIFFPELTANTGAYALVGMGALFISIIRAPFTSLLLAFELTRNYNIILPIMIANMAAYWVASKLQIGSIYENISEQDGIHLPTREDNEILESLNVEDAMVHDPVSLSGYLTVAEALKIAKTHKYSGFPVLKNGLLEGVVSVSDISGAMAKGDGHKNILEISEKKVITIYPDQTLLVGLHKLNRFQISRVPVVSRMNDRKVIGIITVQNIVSKFGYQIKSIEAKENLPLETLEQEYLVGQQDRHKDITGE